MSFTSSLMGVLFVDSESKIFAIFLLYVFSNTRPAAAFKIHDLITLVNTIFLAWTFSTDVG